MAMAPQTHETFFSTTLLRDLLNDDFYQVTDAWLLAL